MTPVGHQLQHFIDAEWKKLEREKITHWLMRFRHGVDIDDGRGGRITTGGDMAFEGTPRDVFWRSIDPHLDDLVNAALRKAHEEGKQFADPIPAHGVEDARLLLHGLINRTFNRMVEVDRALRSKGYPRGVPAYDASGHVERWHNAINDRCAAYLAAYNAAKPKGIARLTYWLDRNKITAVAAAITAISALLGVIKLVTGWP
jgi:hypothetical protein